MEKPKFASYNMKRKTNAAITPNQDAFTMASTKNGHSRQGNESK
jgi:hypothetical protein